MASLMENLISVLGELSEEYEKLLVLSARKAPVIVAGDLQELAVITDGEQEVAIRLNRLDRQREDIMKDIANVMNRRAEELKLTDVIDMLEPRPEEQQQLSGVYDRLSDAVHRVRRINMQNKELLNSALELVEFDMNILQAVKTAPATANYNKGAYSAGSVIGVDQHGFDAKQ